MYCLRKLFWLIVSHNIIHDTLAHDETTYDIGTEWFLFMMKLEKFPMVLHRYIIIIKYCSMVVYGDNQNGLGNINDDQKYSWIW